MAITWHLLTWQLRRSRVGLVALLFGIAVFEFIQPVAIKSFGDLDRIAPLLDLVPPSFWTLMNVTPDFLGTVGLAGYLSLGYTHPVFLVLSSTTAIWFVSRSLAGEMERGSIQFALSRPVSRGRLYVSRLLGALLVTTGAAAIGPLGMAIGIATAQPQGEVRYANLIVTALAAWFLIWSVAGATLLFAATSDTMSRSIGIGIGALVIMYVIDYFAALWSLLEPLAPFSIFNYYEPSFALARGELPLADVLVLGLVGTAGAIGGAVVFLRRDLPV